MRTVMAREADPSDEMRRRRRRRARRSEGIEMNVRRFFEECEIED